MSGRLMRAAMDLSASDLDVGQLATLRVFAWFAEDDGELWRDPKFLCDRVGSSLRMFRYYVESLVEKGYLVVVEKGGGRGKWTRYVVRVKGKTVQPIAQNSGRETVQRIAQIDPETMQSIAQIARENTVQSVAQIATETVQYAQETMQPIAQNSDETVQRAIVNARASYGELNTTEKNGELNLMRAQTRDVGAQTPTRVRARDVIWDAVLSTCGIDPTKPLSRTESSKYAKAITSIKSTGVTDPRDVERHAANYRLWFPNVTLTVNALDVHWGETDSPPPIEKNGNRPQTFTKQRQENNREAFRQAGEWKGRSDAVRNIPESTTPTERRVQPRIDPGTGRRLLGTPEKPQR